MPRTGRPSKLTPRVKRLILEGVSAGLPLQIACERAGITKTSFLSWEERGRKEEEWVSAGNEPNPEEKRFLDFLVDSTRARAEAITTLVAQVRIAAQDEWRAAAWLLSVKDPDNFGKRVNLAGEDGGPVNVRVVWEEGENAE